MFGSYGAAVVAMAGGSATTHRTAADRAAGRGPPPDVRPGHSHGTVLTALTINTLKRLTEKPLP